MVENARHGKPVNDLDKTDINASMLIALMSRRLDEYSYWHEEIKEDKYSRRTYYRTISLVVQKLALKRFGESPEIGDITHFLTSPTHRPIDDLPRSYIDAEAILRSALGEPELEVGISIASATVLKLRLCVFLADDIHLTDSEMAQMMQSVKLEIVREYPS